MLLSFVVYYIVPVVLAVSTIISIVALVVNFSRYRTSAYHRVRQQALDRAWLRLVMVLVALGGVAGALLARQVVPPPTSSMEEPPPLPTLQPEPSATAAAIVPPTITPTRAASTLTPTPLLATVESSVPVPAGFTLEVTAVSSEISSTLTPINIDSTFPVGTPRIYYWLDYNGLLDGVSWSQVLIRNGEVIRSESDIWDQGEEGATYYFFTSQGGWPAGEYEVQFFIGDQLAASVVYQIIN